MQSKQKLSSSQEQATLFLCSLKFHPISHNEGSMLMHFIVLAKNGHGVSYCCKLRAMAEKKYAEHKDVF